MKKMTYNGFSALLCAGVVAAAAAGCSVREQEIPVDVTADSEEEEVYVTVRASMPLETKVALTLDQEASVIRSAWEEGDHIYYNTNSQNYVELTQNGPISEDGKSTDFDYIVNGNIRTLSLSARKGYTFTYPVGYKASSGGNFRVTYQNGSLDSLNVQKSQSNLNYAQDYMVGFVTTGADRSVPDVEFHRLDAFFEVAGLSFPEDLTDDITTIYLTGSNIANRVVLNVNTGAVSSYYRDATITVTPPTPLSVDKGVCKDTLFIAFFPTDSSAVGDECKLVFQTKSGDLYTKEWKASSAYTAGTAYLVSGSVTKPMTSNIDFQDPVVKAICVSTYHNWDLNRDGELSDLEASLVTGLEWWFNGNKNIEYFDEFEYFTGITEFDWAGGSSMSGGFGNCSSLKSIKLPASLELIGTDSFNGCTSLTSIVIPESVKRINAGAFRNCTALESITIPETVQYMGEGNTFNGCTSLKTLNWPDSTTTINAQMFQNSGLTSLTIPETVTLIGNYAFAGCTGLTSIEIPDAVTAINTNAFNGSGLTSVKIGNGVKTIGASAFAGTHLKTVSIGSGITSIGTGAFNNLVDLQSFTIADGTPYSVSPDMTLLLYTNPSTADVSAVSFFGNKDSITFPDNVTIIQAQFAKGSTLLKSVTIPNVKTFGNNAFQDCPNLTTVAYSSDAEVTGNYTFMNDSSLVNVTLPGKATAIGNGLFQNCKSLKSVSIPSTVTKLNSGVFSGCSSLSEITLPEGLTELAQDLFRGCSSLKSIELPSTVTTLGNSALAGTGIESIQLPEGLTSISNSLFNGCSSLKSIDIPESVTTINPSAFQDCTSLTSITIPSKVTTLPQNFIRGCTGIKSITIPSTVTKVNSYTFAYSGLESITLPESITSLASNLFEGCASLTEVNLPSGLTSWGSIVASTFKGCTALKSITIPDKVTEIPMYLFDGCTALTDIKLPASLKTVRQYAFQNCSSLKSITFPASLTTLNVWIMTGSAVNEVIFEGTTPPSGSKTVFQTNAIGTTTYTYPEAIYVPDAAYDAYVAKWSGFKELIFKVSERE